MKVNEPVISLAHFGELSSANNIQKRPKKSPNRFNHAMKLTIKWEKARNE